MDTRQKIDELDQAIAWWQQSLENETSQLQQEAKEAIVRKLIHQRRKLTEEDEGASLMDIWQDIRDTARETYGEFTGHLAEGFNEFFQEKLAPPPVILPPPPEAELNNAPQRNTEPTGQLARTSTKNPPLKPLEK